MRVIKILYTILLCAVLMQLSQAQALDKSISAEYKNLSIEEILKDLSKKHKIQFSYSSNVIPIQQKISISIKNKSIRYLLDEIFKNTNISYQEVGNQVVLKKSAPKNTIKTNTKSTGEIKAKQEIPSSANTAPEQSTLEASIKTTPENISIAEDTTTYFPEITEETFDYLDTTKKDLLQKQYISDKRALKEAYYKKLDSLNLAEGNKSTSKSKLKNEFKSIMNDLKLKINELSEKQQIIPNKKQDSQITSQDTTINVVIDSLGNKSMDTIITKRKKKTLSDSNQYAYKLAQATVFTPIGTNGDEAPNTINGLSFNLLQGYAAGVEGAEFAGLINIEKSHVWGIQFAGFGNVVGKDVRGGQFSGFLNANGGNTQGAQYAGFANIVNGDVFAGQGSGFINVVSGNFKGAQIAGFSNITGKEVVGLQTAGFLNITRKNTKGVQIGGFMNLTGDTLDGVQIAGFLNGAETVKGAQIGFLNVADSVSGIQLGFFSFSKKGYRRFEVFGGETLQGNIAFKSSTSRLHNIYSLSAGTKDNDFYWAFGLGYGTEISLSKRFIINMNLLCNQMHKNGYLYDELNLLNQFKLNAGVLLSKKTSIFAGPSFNVMVSNHYNPDTFSYGLDVVPKYAFYHNTENNINVAMWMGFNAGIRF